MVYLGKAPNLPLSVNSLNVLAKLISDTQCE